MAQLGMNFDANQVEPNDFAPVPAGEYKVMITESDMEPTKDQTGQYLKIQMQILEGPFQGKMIFDRLNLVNRSQKAMEIAQRTLSAICHATGQMHVADSAQLHNIPMVVQVNVTTDGNYNEVKKYSSLQQPVQTGQVQQAPVQNQQQFQPQQAPTQQAAPVQQGVQQPVPAQQQAPVQQATHQEPAPPWAQAS